MGAQRVTNFSKILKSISKSPKNSPKLALITKILNWSNFVKLLKCCRRKFNGYLGRPGGASKWIGHVIHFFVFGCWGLEKFDSWAGPRFRFWSFEATKVWQLSYPHFCWFPSSNDFCYKFDHKILPNFSFSWSYLEIWVSSVTLKSKIFKSSIR